MTKKSKRAKQARNADYIIELYERKNGRKLSPRTKTDQSKTDQSKTDIIKPPLTSYALGEGIERGDNDFEVIINGRVYDVVLTDNGVPRVKDSSGFVIAKVCERCYTLKLRNDMELNRRGSQITGIKQRCKNCIAQYTKKEQPQQEQPQH